MIKYLSDLGVMYMIKSNQILDEKDKRLRKKSIDVTFPLEDKYKKFIKCLFRSPLGQSRKYI